MNPYSLDLFLVLRTNEYDSRSGFGFVGKEVRSSGIPSCNYSEYLPCPHMLLDSAVHLPLEFHAKLLLT